MKLQHSVASFSTRASSMDSVHTHASEWKFKDSTKAVKPKAPGIRRAGLVALALAIAWVLSRYLNRVSRQSRTWGSPRAAAIAFAGLSAFGRLLGITNYNDVQENPAKVPKRQHLICWHPHGLAVLAPLVVLSGEPRSPNGALHGAFITVAGALLKVPGMGALLMTLNARVADKDVMDKLLAAGKTTVICPGGIHEQLATDPKRERIFFAPNLGFVRQAMKHGVPIVPFYNFGENQLFDVPSWMRQTSQFIYKHTGAGVPLGTGRWGLPFVPKPGHISCRLGRAVEVGPADSDPTDARVEQVFRAYCTELYRLFDEHKDAELPADVAAAGLDLVWRGREDVDISKEGLRNEVATDDSCESIHCTHQEALTRVLAGDGNALQNGMVMDNFSSESIGATHSRL